MADRDVGAAAHRERAADLGRREADEQRDSGRDQVGHEDARAHLAGQGAGQDEDGAADDVADEGEDGAAEADAAP